MNTWLVMDDNHFMEMALDLAKMGQGLTSPNPMVGAVIVRENKVVGKGFHRAAGTAHAEIKAIDDAGPLARNATLYVNLEPCNHVGRTPPCSENIVAAGIKRVVVAMRDPNPHVRGGGIEYLETHGVQVTLGVCENQAVQLNEFFRKYIQTKRPFTIVKCAATLDGHIATKTGDSKWVTGKDSRRFVHQLRHAVDAIMVGINTIEKDNPRLTTRLNNVFGDIDGLDPTRIVLDTHLRISEQAKLLRLDSDSDTVIVTGGGVSPKKKAKLETPGVKVVEASTEHELIHLPSLMNLLGNRGITSLLIEGGGRVIASALAAGIVDKIIFFFAPKILGGDDGVPICKGAGASLMKDCLRVKDVQIQRFGDDVMVEGYIVQ